MFTTSSSASNLVPQFHITIYKLVSIYYTYYEYVFILVVYPPLTMNSLDQSPLSANSTPSAYIMSHQQFGESPYPNGVSNQLALTNLPSNQHLFLSFAKMQLGNSNSCLKEGDVQDAFRVFQYGGSKRLYVCGGVAQAPSSQVVPTNSANILLFRFSSKTTSEGFDGFLIRYSCK